MTLTPVWSCLGVVQRELAKHLHPTIVLTSNWMNFLIYFVQEFFSYRLNGKAHQGETLWLILVPLYGMIKQSFMAPMPVWSRFGVIQRKLAKHLHPTIVLTSNWMNFFDLFCTRTLFLQIKWKDLPGRNTIAYLGSLCKV